MLLPTKGTCRCLPPLPFTLTQPSSKTIPSRFKPCISLRRKPLPYINSNMALSRTSNSSSTGAWSRIWFKGSCGSALGRRSGRRGAFILNVGSLSITSICTSQLQYCRHTDNFRAKLLSLKPFCDSFFNTATKSRRVGRPFPRLSGNRRINSLKSRR